MEVITSVGIKCIIAIEDEKIPLQGSYTIGNMLQYYPQVDCDMLEMHIIKSGQ